MVSDPGSTEVRDVPAVPEDEPPADGPRPQAQSSPEIDLAPPAPQPSRASRWLDTLASWWCSHDNMLYALFAMCCTLFAASVFYSYLLWQTGGVWSAPLDDVFIHFDYARSFARGYPFQWSEGNGYSSGNTSLSYPILLALGYWCGFRGLQLMLWAAVISALALLVLLLAAGRMLAPSRAMEAGHALRWARFLFPPAILSMGALDWTLFSGMENAFHLGVWGGCLLLVLAIERADDARRARRLAWVLGGVGALLVATRPESGVCVAAFAIFAAERVARRGLAPSWRERVLIVARIAAPPAALLVAHAVANRLLTGEWAASGALAKLFLNDPYLTVGEKWARYVEIVGYLVPRLVMHHFAAPGFLGFLVVGAALAPLAAREVRPHALLLWAQVIAWVLLVCLNNQARWHNERYAMPAVAWIMILAALGVAVVAGAALRSTRRWAAQLSPPRVALALGMVALYWYGQAPRAKDQVWFFGRAGRNILDQHITTGMVLERVEPRRVLVGDAGAITYASDLPGLDLIGLGGYHDFPFARSTVHGLGATIELIERIPAADRPDVMAIYPGWWGELPTLFGSYLTEIPVRGNVICGGPEKVIYRANWASLDRQGRPRSLLDGERILDEVDVADLLSEDAHDYAFPRPGTGFVEYRVLQDAPVGGHDLFDAGRIIAPGRAETAHLRGGGGSARLVLRVALEKPMKTELAVDGRIHATIEGEPLGTGWQEVSVALPDGLGEFDISLTPLEDSTTIYHLWVVAR